MSNLTLPSETKGLRLGICLVACAVAALLTPHLLKAGYRISWDYNEGWNAGHAARAMAGANLYDTGDLLITNNYPPLSFYLIGALGRITGDLIFAGRAVAILALLWTAVNISLAVHYTVGNLWAAVFAGAHFLGLMALHFDHYIGINDPQMLGHGVMTAAYVFFVRRRTPHTAFLPLAILICLGGFIKHNLLSLPVAVSVYLLAVDRRAFYRWLLIAGSLLAVALGISAMLFGSHFFDSLLAPRSFSVTKLCSMSSNTLFSLRLPLAVWLLCAAVDRNRPMMRFNVFFVIVAAMTGVVMSGGVGVDENAFFELAIGLSIGIGQGIGRIAEGGLRRTLLPGLWAAIIPLAVGVGMVVKAPGAVLRFVDARQQWQAMEEETVANVQYVANGSGRVLCETIALAYWAGKPFNFDAFNSRQAFLRGAKDERLLLLEPIGAGAFDLIQVRESAGELNDERFSPEFRAALLAHYRVARVGVNGGFFVPKSRR